MKTKLLLLFSFIGALFFVNQASAQKVTYGPTMGLYYDNPIGAVLLDSIQVILEGKTARRPYMGAFISYDLTNTFTLTSGVNYYNDATSYLVYNKVVKCDLCPIVKGGLVANPSVEIPLLLETKLKVPVGKIFLSTGIIPNVRLRRTSSPYYYHVNAGEGVSDVLPAMKSAVRAVVWTYSLGIGADIWRLRLEARWQHDLAESATKAIEVWDRRYDFYSKNSTFRVGLGYKLRWKIKE
jgi:hypothetical protein